MDKTAAAPQPAVVLAPLSGITDLPFRQVVAGFGAAWTVSEMVAAGQLLSLRRGSRERAELGLGDGRTVVQLAGREPGPMAEAARMVADRGAPAIDINMGCPARKVTGGLSGAALMRDLDHAERMIAAVVGAVTVPVSVKMRLGWDDDQRNAAALARRAEAAGARRITVHGRTRCQFYTGSADWAAIRPVVQAVTIPVTANGDILDAATAAQALARSGAEAVMVGRGAQGRPWQLARIAAGLAGQRGPKIPTGSALSDLVSGHYEAMLTFYSTPLGAKVARKHLGWYMDHAGTPAPLRQEVLTAPPPRVLALLPLAMDGAPAMDKVPA